jgi:hypothetical protein
MKLYKIYVVDENNEYIEVWADHLGITAHGALMVVGENEVVTKILNKDAWVHVELKQSIEQDAEQES